MKKKDYSMNCEGPCGKKLTIDDLIELEFINPLKPILCPKCKHEQEKLNNINLKEKENE
jgi:hypothetical protein